MSIENKLTTIAENTPRVYAAGQKAEYDRFWDAYQDSGKRTDYTYAFASIGWTDENFKPKYDIRPTTCRNMFVANIGITDLKDLLEKQGVVLDTSKSTDVSYMFYYSGYGATITHIPTIDASSNTTGELNRIFYSVSIKTVEKFIVASSDRFVSCINAPDLERIIFDGTIGGNGLSVSTCTKLDHASLMSIINALQDTPSISSPVVTLGETNLAKLTDAEKAIATEKGWTLA